MTLSDRSRKNLQGVHPDLVRVVEKAAESCEFIVTEGLRTLARQTELKAAGKSKTLNSRHLTGHAIDVCDCDGCYDLKDLEAIAAAMKAAARDLNVPLEWGGDWKWKDRPHFQLTWKAYPSSGLGTVAKLTEHAKTKPAIATVAATVATAAPEAVKNLPPPPDLSGLSAYQTAAEQAGSLGIWAWSHPWLTAGLALWLILATIAPNLVSRLTPASPP